MEALFNNINTYSNSLFIGKPQQNNISGNLKKLMDSKIIQINNELNGIFNDQIKLPRIVFVGSSERDCSISISTNKADQIA